MSAGRARFRAASAALSVVVAAAAAAQPPPDEEVGAIEEQREEEEEGGEVFRARPLASFSGTPVDFEVAFFGGTGGLVFKKPVELFVGLPGDYGGNVVGEKAGRREEEAAATAAPPLPLPPSSSLRSSSSPTLTSVVKRLRRAGVPAAIFPFWDFDAAAEQGRLAEAILEAARGALERE